MSLHPDRPGQACRMTIVDRSLRFRLGRSLWLPETAPAFPAIRLDHAVHTEGGPVSLPSTAFVLPVSRRLTRRISRRTGLPRQWQILHRPADGPSQSCGADNPAPYALLARGSRVRGGYLQAQTPLPD